MKVLPFQIPKPENHALFYQEDKALIFYDKFHQHDEIQVSYIAEGEGTLVVGDTINYYKKGDLLSIGSNLPHVFKSDRFAYKNSEMITLFFSRDAFGESFFNLEDFRELKPFFKKVSYGFKYSSKSDELKHLFIQLHSKSKLQRFLILLEILKILSKLKTQPLSSYIQDKKYTDSEGKRLRDALDYTMRHYHNQISLRDIAAISAMTKNAFCKYFKKHTNKTYFQFLNELRIEKASKYLLMEEVFTIADVSEKAGFNNISNFNRQFKNIKKMTPSSYRKKKNL